MKRVLRLTESDLRGIIKKSVNKLLREFGSDGPDWDEINSGEIYDGPNNYRPHAQSASDMDDFDVDKLNIYGGNDDMDDIDYDLDDEYPIDFNESRGMIGRIIRESVNKVLKESEYETTAQQQERLRKKSNPNKFNKKITDDDWQDVYKDKEGKRIQSKGHGPNKKWRTV